MKVRNFSWPLFLSPFISRMGDSLYIFGLNWFVVKATGTTSLLGMVQAFGGIVLLLGDFFCGVLIDNYNRKRILVASEFISLAACFSFAFIVNPNNPAPWQLLTLTGVLDVGLAFSLPAAKAIVPEVIHSKALQRFNALSNTTINLADVVAPLIGGLLLTIKWINFREFLAINGISFTISFLLFVFMPYKMQESTRERLSIFDSLASGFKYVLKSPLLIENVALSGVANVMYAAARLVLPYDVNHFYGGKSALYSILLSALAIGGILGGLRLTFESGRGQREKNYRDLIIASGMLMITGIFKFYPVLLVFALVYGFSMASFNIRAFTVTQDLTDNQYLGRIFGIWFIAIDGLQPIGSFVFGWATDYLHNWSFLAIGICLAIGIVAVNHMIQGMKKA